MDASLLEMFARSLRSRLAGRVIGPVRWLRPILTVSVARRDDREFVVAVLGPPGPFCHLADLDPLEGVQAAEPFPLLTGARVSAVARLENQRVLRLEAEPAGDTTVADETLRLHLMLFGSAGRAELTRGGDGDETVVKYVGGRKRGGPVVATGVRIPDSIPAGAFYLTAHGLLERLKPSTEDDPHADHRLGPFRDALEACRAAGDRIVGEAQRRIVRARARPIARRVANRQTLQAKLESDLKRASEHALVRREAETLAAYQSRIRPGDRTTELPDIYHPGETVSIDLDPALPIRVQVEKRFKRAAKLERSESHVRRRLEEIEREIEALRGAIDAVENAGGFAASMAELDRQLALLPGLQPAGRAATYVAGGVGPHPGARTSSAAGTPFRRYPLSDEWFVLVGRSNRENDELTFHAAAPTDWWLHAQHVPGSHVVLKSRGNPGAPPPAILEKAAAVAAHFSKARHSGLVPVIYTQRKYVRKPRGARPGQVVCEREKMIMVEPGLPAVKP
jgi:hypothetical protein